MKIIKANSYFFKYRNSKDWILRDINFELEKGEALLILGPNGSGKTTLALSLLGLAQRYPSEFKGVIEYKGKNILEYERAEIAKNAGIVQQDPEAQIITLTVEDEIAFGLENLLYKDIEERIERSLKLVRLEDKRNEETSSLSYGEKQKLILSSVLALDNELIILDEPTSNLDPLSRREFFKILPSLKNKGVTFVIIEHNVDELLGFVDKVLILNKKGEIVIIGSFPQSITSLNPSLIEELGIWLPYKLEQEILPQPKFFTKAKIESEKSVSVKNLSFFYSKEKILKNINIDFEAGKMNAILGHNGAGKTTLCKILAGILKRYEGKIILRSKNVRYCFQNPDVQFIGKTVLEEVTISMKSRFKNSEARIKARELLKDFFEESILEMNPHMLSEGQKRLLSVVSMLAYEPDVLILDEPTFALDRYNSRKIMNILRSIADSGKTVIFSTHDLRLTLEYADKITILNKGEVVFDGELFHFIEKIKDFEKFNIVIPNSLEEFPSLKEYVMKIRGYSNEA